MEVVKLCLLLTEETSPERKLLGRLPKRLRDTLLESSLEPMSEVQQRVPEVIPGPDLHDGGHLQFPDIEELLAVIADDQIDIDLYYQRHLSVFVATNEGRTDAVGESVPMELINRLLEDLFDIGQGLFIRRSFRVQDVDLERCSLVGFTS